MEDARGEVFSFFKSALKVVPLFGDQSPKLTFDLGVEMYSTSPLYCEMLHRSVV